VSSIEFLGLEDLLILTTKLGAGPVRDLGLLDSAVARPRTSLFGEDAYPTLEAKAAALMHSVCQNHPLVDGNKRLAFLAASTFLEANGRRMTMTQDEAFELTMRVAEGAYDVPEIAAVLSAGSTGAA
jgi:death on curing protein